MLRMIDSDQIKSGSVHFRMPCEAMMMFVAPKEKRTKDVPTWWKTLNRALVNIEISKELTNPQKRILTAQTKKYKL